MELKFMESFLVRCLMIDFVSENSCISLLTDISRVLGQCT